MSGSFIVVFVVGGGGGGLVGCLYHLGFDLAFTLCWIRKDTIYPVDLDRNFRDNFMPISLF